MEQLAFRPQAATWPAILHRLESLRYRAAVVGPHGSGKTTFMEELAARLLQTGRQPCLLRINEDNRRYTLPDVTPRTIILFDGADHLPWLQWRKLKSRTQNAAGLIITSHRHDMLPTLLETTTTPDLLRDLVSELSSDVSPDLIDDLFNRHRGNLRDALFNLYDRFASQSSPTPAAPVASQTP